MEAKTRRIGVYYKVEFFDKQTGEPIEADELTPREMADLWYEAMMEDERRQKQNEEN